MHAITVGDRRQCESTGVGIVRQSHERQIDARSVSCERAIHGDAKCIARSRTHARPHVLHHGYPVRRLSNRFASGVRNRAFDTGGIAHRNREVIRTWREVLHDVRRKAGIVERHGVGIAVGGGTPVHAIGREVRQRRSVGVGGRRRPAQRRRAVRHSQHGDVEGRPRRRRLAVADTDHDVIERAHVACRRRALQSARRRAERRPRRTVRNRERQWVAVRIGRRRLKGVRRVLHHRCQRRARDHRNAVRRSCVAHHDRKRRQTRRDGPVADTDDDVSIAPDVRVRGRS